MYGRKGIRHASLVYIEVELKGLARGAAEFVCQCSKSRQLHRRPRLKSIANISQCFGFEGSSACCDCTATLPMKRQQAVRRRTFLIRVQTLFAN